MCINDRVDQAVFKTKHYTLTFFNVFAFLFFKIQKRDFLRFYELLHTFSRTLVVTEYFSRHACMMC